MVGAVAPLAQSGLWTGAGCNATEYVVETGHCRGMIVDLSDLGFFGTEGFCDPHGLLPTNDTVDRALATLRPRVGLSAS
jgi:hypothetical protein